jgi:hypothetical protein
MEQAGRPRDEIWRDTGWFRGADKNWWFEVDDHGMMYRDPFTGFMTLGTQLTNADRVFAAYPEMKQVRAGVHDGGDGNSGTFAKGGLLRRHKVTASNSSSASHEIQHVIGAIEGRGYGSSLRNATEHFENEFDSYKSKGLSDFQSAYEVYKRTDGEVMARLTQKRLQMTAAERAARPPWLDYDVPEDGILRVGSGDEGPSLATEAPLRTALADAARDMHLKDVVEACRA